MFGFIKDILRGKNNAEVSSTLVCNCMKVTVDDVKDAIKNGAKSFEDVQAITKAGTGCGNCTHSVKGLVNSLTMDNSTVVCGCMKVTVKDIKDAIKSGAKSFEDVQEITKVSTGCGNCKESVQALVKDLLLN